MTEPPFLGPRVKVQRGLRHIQEAEAWTQAFVKTDFYDVVVDTESDPGGSFVGVVVKNNPPITIPLAMGDAIHNLRASLDFLASEIMRTEGKDHDRVRFPFYEDRENLVQQREKGSKKNQKGNQQRTRGDFLRDVSPEVAQLIIDEIKPYKEGNYGLWALNKLDNIDKHKLILPAFTATQICGISGSDSYGNVSRNNAIELYGPGEGFLPFKFAPDFQLNAQPQAVFEVRFDETQFFEGKEVFETLRALAENVTSVIDAFAALGLGAPPDA